jgi:glutamate-ammonia-ligase adenylyltransferase
MREAAVRRHTARYGDGIDVKTGTGGLRDIEFLVQGLQLIHAAAHPDLLTGNTLHGLRLLGEKPVLRADVVDQLADDYVFLRRVEHFLQIMDDRQTHVVPHSASESEALARRVMGPETSGPAFLEHLRSRLQRVRTAMVTSFPETDPRCQRR